MAALMIHETMMLAIGVMTHTMILEIMMQVISLLLLLSKDCVLYSTCIALFLLCMQCACAHIPSPLCNDSHHDPGDHESGHLGNTYISSYCG